MPKAVERQRSLKKDPWQGYWQTRQHHGSHAARSGSGLTTPSRGERLTRGDRDATIMKCACHRDRQIPTLSGPFVACAGNGCFRAKAD